VPGRQHFIGTWRQQSWFVDDDRREHVERAGSGVWTSVRAVLRAGTPEIRVLGRKPIGQPQARATAVTGRNAVADEYLVGKAAVGRDLEQVRERPDTTGRGILREERHGLLIDSDLCARRR